MFVMLGIPHTSERRVKSKISYALFIADFQLYLFLSTHRYDR